MRTKAAVLYAPNTEYTIEEIELDPPKEGEVLVKFAASGMCHSDEHVFTGDMVLDPEILEAMGWQAFPVICGHEGSGTVIEVGPNVAGLSVGDHVVTSFIPACGACPSCSTGHSNLCDLGANLMSGHQLDGTTRHHTLSGDDLAPLLCLGTFAEHSVMHYSSLIKIDPDIPLDKAALVACGVTTGWGASVYVADVKVGETVVVIGCGGVGMNAVQGAAMAGARYVIAVDPVEFKREQSQVFGATHAVSSIEEASALLAELTWGRNAEKVIMTTGLAEGDMVAPMMSLVAKNGRAVVTSVGKMTDTDVQLNLFDLAMQQKQLVGHVYGGANPRYDVPRLLGLYQSGQLKLDELITNTYDLTEINQGYQDMRDGKNIRGVIIY